MPELNTIKQTANTLRILFVEDSEQDVLLEAALLEAAGYELEYTRVDTAAALQQALNNEWDIILSDFNMPAFSGMDALRIIREADKHVPFILVTGAIGEEEAVSLMRAGAQDYINKNHPARLIPAIQRELGEAKLRQEKLQAQQALQNEQEFAKQLLDTAPVIVLVLNADGSIEHVNPFFEELSGYRLDEIRGKEWFSTFLPARDQDRVRSLFHSALGSERTRGKINPIVTRDGIELEIEWHDNVIKDNKGNIQQLIAIGQDVTERKRADENVRYQARLLDQIFEHSKDDIVLLDKDYNFIRVSNSYAKSCQRDISAFPGHNHFEIYPSDLQDEIEPYRLNKTTYKRESRPFIFPDHPEWGTTYRDLSMIPVLDDKNEIELFLFTLKDVTDKVRSEQTLRERKIQLTEAQAIGHMGNWNWDIQAGTLYWSDEIYRIFGLHPQAFDATYEAFINTIHPDDRELVQTAVNKALHEMQAYSIDHRIRLPDDSIRFVHEQGEVRFDENGEPLRMIGTVQDITERKLTEQALRKSEARFRATFEQAAVGVSHVGLDGNWLRVNDRLCQILGYGRDELIKTTFQDITHPDDLQTDLEVVQELLRGAREHYSLEKRYLRKDGSVTWVQLTVTLVRNAKNEPDYFISVVEDINNRKTAEARILTALDEKDTVLRELHHRVKNNMQVISSLLSLQARYASTHDPQLALQDSRQRIRAMALIHERLYSNTDLAAVDFLDYLRYLGERLERLYHEPGTALKIQVSGEPLKLSVDIALPCALICNELITNAVRHAYPADQRERLIEVRITDTSTGWPQIVVRDYGRGIDHKKLTDEPDTLGLVIIKALTRQLDGEIQFESIKGTSATLVFPKNSPTTREIAHSPRQLQKHSAY